MTTEKKIEANKKNALRSTGPKTSTGKFVSSRNAIRHGFYATTVVLPAEDAEEYLRLARRLAAAYQPCGVLEEELVRTIIETQWQLRRANLVDTQLFRIFQIYKGKERGPGTAFAHDAQQGNAFSKLTKYQSFLLRKRADAEKGLHELRKKGTQVPHPIELRQLNTSNPAADCAVFPSAAAEPNVNKS